VKFTVIKLRNISGRPRRVSVTGYWEWVMGDLRQKNLLHVRTEVDLKTGALFARNFYNAEFSRRIALCRCQRRDAHDHWGQDGVPWPQWAAVEPRSAGACTAFREGGAGGSIHVEPCR